MTSSFAAQSVAEAIGTQSVKVMLVRMCLCLVGTHESMFLSCMNMPVFYWCVCVIVGLVQMPRMLNMAKCLPRRMRSGRHGETKGV